jgi:glycosyltransferase involved in cell wall biosynthesis
MAGRSLALRVIYDITRLAARTLRRTPNGIDRVDLGFARHFLEKDDQSQSALLFTLRGPRHIDAVRARKILEKLGTHWHEACDPAGEGAHQKLENWLREYHPTAGPERHIHAPRPALGDVLPLCHFATIRGRALVPTVPKNAVYLNVSQFPLWMESYFGWLRTRPDVKAVFFIHDLLPLEMPEFFPAAELERHTRRLETLAKFGAGAIVATQSVRAALDRHLHSLGRSSMPILSLPMPASETFTPAPPSRASVPLLPYFVLCATLEPRKNHAFLLHVWKELIRRSGTLAPKLVLVGARGWKNENAVDLLERSHHLKDHVMHVEGLSTPSLKDLMSRSCGVLMPSFAEGYGLPVVEALAAGAPVIASDIEVFREIEDPRLTRISPIDGERWLAEIQRHVESGWGVAQPSTAKVAAAQTWDGYFGKVQEFLERL